MSDEFEIEVKRFYVPNEFTIECPKCGGDVCVPNGYLSYPTANVVFDYTPYCGSEWKDENGEWTGCDHEWKIKARLNLSFELIEDE